MFFLTCSDNVKFYIQSTTNLHFPHWPYTPSPPQINPLSKSHWSEYIEYIQITTRPEIVLSPVSKPYLAINKVSDRMTGMPEQIAPAPDQVEIEGAVENDKKEPGEKNKDEVKKTLPLI